MTTGNVLTDVRKGMEVRTANGTLLGRIAHVWFSVDPASSASDAMKKHAHAWRCTCRGAVGSTIFPIARFLA